MSTTASARATTAPAITSHERSDLTIHECEYCDVHYPEPYGYSEQGCTKNCHWRYEAQKLLWGIQYDHQYCRSCFRQLKTVYAPGHRRAKDADKAIPECAIGEAFPKPHTIRGEASERTLTRDEIDEWEWTDSGLIKITLVCSCGATDHTDDWRSDRLSKRETVTHGARLLDALRERTKRNQCEADLDADAFFEYLRKMKSIPDLQARVSDAVVFTRALGFALWWAQRPWERS